MGVQPGAYTDLHQHQATLTAMPPATEHHLLKAVKDGDRQAMRILYDRYSGYAMAVVLRYVPQRDEAQDVFQDGFVKVLTTIGRFDYRGEGSLKAWICRIMANEAIDYLKSRQRFTFLSSIPDEADDEAPPDVDHIPPEVLTRLIGQLPAGYRAVLSLHVFEQMSHKEIARMLDISESTSASQFNRAKQKLARLLKDYLKTTRVAQ